MSDRRRWLMLLAFALIAAGTLQAAGRTDVPLAPRNGHAVRVDAGKGERTYYRLDRDSTLVLHADGPGVLTVFSRVLPRQGTGGAVGYTLVLSSGSSVRRKHSTEAGPADAVVRNYGGPVGALRKFTLPLGEGSHRLVVRLEGVRAPAALVRFTLRPSGGKLVPLEPLSYARVMRVCGTAASTLYVADTTQAVRIRAVGPALMKVVARAVLDTVGPAEWKGTLLIREGLRDVARHRVSSRRTAGLRFCDHAGGAPGTAEEFLVPVPDGEHVYEIGPVGARARPVLLKFSVPKKALRNGR